MILIHNCENYRKQSQRKIQTRMSQEKENKTNQTTTIHKTHRLNNTKPAKTVLSQLLDYADPALSVTHFMMLKETNVKHGILKMLVSD